MASILVLVLAGALLASACGPSTPGAPTSVTPTELVIATGGTGGTYYPLGGGLEKIINKVAPTVKVSVQSTGASAANARMLGDKTAGIALIQNDVAAFAYKGTEMFAGKPIENIRGVMSWYPETIQFVTLKDSGIKSITDLKGKRVAIGAQGSGTMVEALAILNASGITKDNADFRYADFAQIAQELQNKTIDAGFVVAGIPTAAVTELTISREVNIVDIPDATFQAIKAKSPFFVQVPIPANTYKGQDQAVKTVAVLAIITTRADIPADVIYSITKGTFENLDILVATHARAKDIKLAAANDGMPIPLHPGAEKYFKEKGLIK
jgi:TRAP transporter TAXI family solute receptor